MRGGNPTIFSHEMSATGCEERQGRSMFMILDGGGICTKSWETVG